MILPIYIFLYHFYKIDNPTWMIIKLIQVSYTIFETSIPGGYQSNWLSKIKKSITGPTWV
jgi:hypothetical protein